MPVSILPKKPTPPAACTSKKSTKKPVKPAK